MKFISWNIDGAKAILRKTRFRELLWMWQADIFAFQETKLADADMRLLFPAYYAYWSFCKSSDTTHPKSGTVCICRYEPINVSYGIGDDNFDTEGRIITLEYDHYYFINCYVPQSQDAVAGRNKESSIERREYRAGFDRLLRNYVCDLNKKKPIILCGDFNAAIAEIDMSKRSRWQDGNTGFSKDATDQLRKLTKSGFTDTFRYLHPDEKKAYTHWHVKDKDRTLGIGRRLDYFFVSDDLAGKVSGSNIMSNILGSDHCPIELTIDLSEPVIRGDVIFNLTYDDLLLREKTGAYFSALKNADLTRAWNTIDWDRAKSHLQEMQKDIVLACTSGNLGAIEKYQFKLVVSLDAKLLAVRSVTSRNGQVGVDRVKWKTPDQKMHAALSLNSKGYHARSSRVVERTDHRGKLRRFNIDTYKDRAMQTLYGYSLAPVAETWSDRKSFSNRRCRSTFDANYYICKIYSGEDAPLWALKTDIQKCYESIDHEWIIKHIPMATDVLKEFLRAGYFLSDKYYEEDEGIGVGSRLSPYLANMSMDGLQDYIYTRLNPGVPSYLIDHKYGDMVRFADDILISAGSRNQAEQIVSIVRDFMRERHLLLSDKKTEIIYIPDGFDFLKRTYSKDGEYLNVRPSDVAVISFKNKVVNLIEGFKGSQERLIDELNRKIIGFVSQHKMTDALKTFHDLDVDINLALFKLCKEKSPTDWSRERIIQEYWYTDADGNHIYAVKGKPQKHVIRMEDTIMTHYYPVPLSLNPYLDYDRIDDISAERDIENVTGEYKKIWARQEGRCEYCLRDIRPDDDRELVEINPSEKNMIDRMAYIHSRCRNLVIEYEDHKETEHTEKDETKGLMVGLSDEYAIEDVSENPLYRFFKEQEKPTVYLSFKKIGEILGSPLTEIAYERQFWFDDAENKLCRCWLDNNYFVKRVSTEGRKGVTFHKYKFTGDTGKVNIPDLLLHGEVPLRMKYEIESMLKYAFEHNGLPWSE